jgi:zinc-finger-containing domain
MIKTPWNPSRSATKRVKNPLPAPTVCPNCGDSVGLVSNEAIYRRKYGEWPWAYKCNNAVCDSYVGLHPFTNIPLGTLANKVTREARKRAKTLFNPLWDRGGMTRSEAYTWLAGQLGIVPVENCHIGWFDVAMCERVIDVCKRRKA